MPRNLVSNVFSSGSTSALRDQQGTSKSIAIDVFSFASKRPDGRKHYGVNARAPDAFARTVLFNKLLRHKPRVPIRLTEAHIRSIANRAPLDLSDCLPSSRASCASEVGQVEAQQSRGQGGSRYYVPPPKSQLLIASPRNKWTIHT